MFCDDPPQWFIDYVSGGRFVFLTDPFSTLITMTCFPASVSNNIREIYFSYDTLREGNYYSDAAWSPYMGSVDADHTVLTQLLLERFTGLQKVTLDIEIAVEILQFSLASHAVADIFGMLLNKQLMEVELSFSVEEKKQGKTWSNGNFAQFRKDFIVEMLTDEEVYLRGALDLETNGTCIGAIEEGVVWRFQLLGSEPKLLTDEQLDYFCTALENHEMDFWDVSCELIEINRIRGYGVED